MGETGTDIEAREDYGVFGRRAHLCVGLALALVGASCGGVRSVPNPRAPGPPGSAGFVQEGLASYYASSLAGNRTASGERYDPGKLTAAHRTLPFGTRVRVSRLDAEGRPRGPAVSVVVNDRGPFSGRRIIDLSREAAKRLDMIRAGVVRVRLEADLPRR